MVTATNQTEKRLQAEARDGDYLYDDDGKNNDAKQGQLLKTETEAQQPPQKLASIAQVFSFGKPFETKLLLLLGAVCAAIAGLVAVGMIFFLTESYTDLSADPTTNEFMEQVKELSFSLMVLGVIAFLSLSAYSALLQTAARQMTVDLSIQWYQALLRQDMAFYDIMDLSGVATMISTNAEKYNRGLGNKLGLAIQFTFTFTGGIAYAFYASWRTALITLLTVPFMAISGWFLVKMNTSQSQRANASYAQAGSLVYTTATSIRTILSLNGAPRNMIQEFKAATNKNFQQATSQVFLLGLANGSMMSSFLLSSIAVPLYGGFLLHDQVLDNGCDPSGAVPNVETCNPGGADVFGAMFGIFFAASVLPQISNAMESFIDARAACALAMEVMNRNTDPNETATTAKESKSGDGNSQQQQQQQEEEEVKAVARHAGSNSMAMASLPKYVIDSASPSGLKPPADQVKGDILFHDVTFAYPTRSQMNVLNQFSLLIPAGKTVALVGSSGSGKSTVAQLVERFYDPTGGRITLDGTPLTELNVEWLRHQIGLVSQEPTLFACSIRDNIAYGCPGATMEQVEEAARIANCYDFIKDFPNGFDTQVGDRGAKMSGGQKQRIAIARIIIKNPKILILDEATSALDSASERIVQMAIDGLLEKNRCTTIVIAHRLSTIRQADVIVVMKNGRLVESGSHDILMEEKGEYYGFVEAQKAPKLEERSESEVSSTGTSVLKTLESSISFTSTEDEAKPVLRFRGVHFEYPSRPDSKILDNFNLSVKKGETLALVGPSGHGKSTLISLSMRFYDPTGGYIELDGKPLTMYNPKWLRSQFGLVSQEPMLFDTTIAENIKFGLENATQEEIEKASRDANAHSFITGFPMGYDTEVGEGGTQVSGGQKQRICIARLLLRRSRILLLDEATSALDTESERMVQVALDRVMALGDQTTIVVAHRLSTIQNADRIAVIMNGKLKEIGSYEELMAKEGGHFRRLQAFQNMDDAPVEPEHEKTETEKSKEHIEQLKEKKRLEKEEEEKEMKELDALAKDKKKRNASRARELARGSESFFVIGAIGGLLAGSMFPAWGLIFAYMIKLLYTPVLPCEENEDICDEYYKKIANDMKDLANSVAYGSVGTIIAAMIGYSLLYYGFGQATERMNKRIREQAFESLIRQEVAWFDLHPVGKLTSELQDDAALLHSFSGQPIRILVLNLSSVFVGLVLGLFYMWEFALLFLGVLPFMGFGAEMEMRMYVKAEDEGDDSLLEDEHSPGGIVIESLMNIKTVASMCLEQTKLKEYGAALRAQNPRPLLTNFLKGCGFGLGQFFQFWGFAIMYWFGAWILHNNPDTYEFTDFVVSMFALFFSLYGLTVALEGATDRKRAMLAANRIFDLIDRKSPIDPLSDAGLMGDKTSATTRKEDKEMPTIVNPDGAADVTHEIHSNKIEV